MSMMLRMAGTLGQRRMSSPLHPQTLDYIARLKDVDGHDPAFDAANDYLIRELVNLGGAYWDTMGTMTTLVGKKWEGLLVPLRDGMNVGTNVDDNFVIGDFNAKTGLIGDGSTKYINSNRNNNADGRDDQSMGVWLTSVTTLTSYVSPMGADESHWAKRATSSSTYVPRNRSSTANVFNTDGIFMPGYEGMSRSNSANFDFREKGGTRTLTRASSSPVDQNVFVMARNSATGAALHSNERSSLYHIGPALNLATLDGILTEYMSRINEVTL